MSLDDLIQHDVTDPAPADDVAARLYVPRQDLDGTWTRLEDAVERDVRQAHRVAVIGPSGSGKSSLTAWLAANNPDLATVRLPLANTATNVPDPGAVLSDLVAQLQRLMTQPKPRMKQKEAKVSGQVGFDWLRVGAEATWAAVVTEHTPGAGALAAFEVLQQVVDGLHDEQAQLLLVFDDTDKWNAARMDDPGSINAFFHGVVEGWLVRLDGALIASVHNDYLDPHPNILDGFNATHVLQPLSDTAVKDLVSTRYALAGLDINDYVEDAAIDELVALYQERGHSVRAVLQVLRTAIDRALDARQERVAPPHITAAR